MIPLALLAMTGLIVAAYKLTGAAQSYARRRWHRAAAPVRTAR